MKKTLLFLCSLAMAVGAYCQDSALVKTIRQDVEILASDSLEGRGFRCASKSLAVDYLNRRFAQIGLTPYKGTYKHTFWDFGYLAATQGTNLIGVIEGSDSILKKEYIVIGGHYDHVGWKMVDTTKVIFNGADDNASGTSAVLSIAQKLMAMKGQLKRSIIIIAFDGEEAGLLGSKDIVENKVIDIANVKAMFSLDMVGMYEKNKGLDVSGFHMLTNGNTLLKQVSDSLQIIINKNQSKLENRTDTQPFGNIGIPAMHIFTGEVSPYHKPEDDSNLLDYNGIAKVVEMTTNFAQILATQPTIESKTKIEIPENIAKKSSSKFRIGYLLGIGSSQFDYTDTYFYGKEILAYQLGVTSQIRLNKFIRLQPSVVYESYGSNSDYGLLRIHAASPSLDLLLTTKSPQNAFAYIAGGLYYRYNFAATAKSGEFNFNDQLNPYDLGYRLSVGFCINKIQINFLTGRSLVDLNNHMPNGGIRNIFTNISVSKFF